VRGAHQADREIGLPSYLRRSFSFPNGIFNPGREPAWDHLFLKKYIPAITRAVMPRRIPTTTTMNAGDPGSMDGPPGVRAAVAVSVTAVVGVGVGVLAGRVFSGVTFQTGGGMVVGVAGWVMGVAGGRKEKA
jgi:hypothetical protein